MRTSWLTATLLALIAAEARADDSRTVVVFPPEVQNADVDASDIALLQRALESDLGPALSPSGYTVLTDENARELLKDRNIDPEAVRRAETYLEVARAAKLTLFVTIRVTASGGALNAEVRLFETASGGMLASEEVEGQDGASLRKAWKHYRDHFLAATRTGLAARTPPAAPAAGISPAELKELHAACDRSEPSKCLRLGRLYEKGTGVPVDLDRAADCYGRACSGGYSDGCAALHAMKAASAP